jgi:hypothetical protein
VPKCASVSVRKEVFERSAFRCSRRVPNALLRTGWPAVPWARTVSCDFGPFLPADRGRVLVRPLASNFRLESLHRVGKLAQRRDSRPLFQKVERLRPLRSVNLWWSFSFKGGCPLEPDGSPLMSCSSVFRAKPAKRAKRLSARNRELRCCSHSWFRNRACVTSELWRAVHF